jgi:thioredoxin-dependent peroxiredoxin
MSARWSRPVLASVVAIAVVGWASVQASGSPPKVGDVAPDFKLSTLDDEPVELETLRKSGPVVLVVLRGWPGYQCPLCTQQAGAFLGQAKKFQQAKAHVVLVYPGPAENLNEHAREFSRKAKLPEHFHFVTDPDFVLTNDYDLRWDAAGETAYPSTFVINPDGEITWARVSKDHGGRTTPAEVLKALKSPSAAR